MSVPVGSVVVGRYVAAVVVAGWRRHNGRDSWNTSRGWASMSLCGEGSSDGSSIRRGQVG